MATIDDVNTILLDMLNRFGCRDVSTDLTLYRLSVLLIKKIGEGRKYAFPAELSNAVTAVFDPIDDLKQIRIKISDAKLSPKTLDDLVAHDDQWESIEELLHFSLYNESSEFIGSAESEIDFWFMGQFISDVVVRPNESDHVDFSQFTAGIFLADALVQWAKSISKGVTDIATAISKLSACFGKLLEGEFVLVHSGAGSFLPILK